MTRTITFISAISLCLFPAIASAQMISISRSSRIQATGPGGASDMIEISDFSDFNQSLSFGTLGGAASQTSTIRPGVVTFTGSAQSGAGAGHPGSGSSFLAYEFQTTQAFAYVLSGTSVASGSGNPLLVLRRTDVPMTLFSQSSSGSFNTADLLPPGSYLIRCSVDASSFQVISSLQTSLSIVPLAFAIPWSTLDGGGSTIATGPFSLSGTIGQFDAAIPIVTGGPFRLTSGYWARDPGTPICVADFDDGSGTGQPDGGVTIDDLLYYLALFGDGSVSADVDDGSSTGTADGGVTIDDLLYFLVRYEAGC